MAPYWSGDTVIITVKLVKKNDEARLITDIVADNRHIF